MSRRLNVRVINDSSGVAGALGSSNEAFGSRISSIVAAPGLSAQTITPCELSASGHTHPPHEGIAFRQRKNSPIQRHRCIPGDPLCDFIPPEVQIPRRPREPTPRRSHKLGVFNAVTTTPPATAANIRSSEPFERRAKAPVTSAMYVPPADVHGNEAELRYPRGGHHNDARHWDVADAGAGAATNTDVAPGHWDVADAGAGAATNTDVAPGLAATDRLWEREDVKSPRIREHAALLERGGTFDGSHSPRPVHSGVSLVPTTLGAPPSLYPSRPWPYRRMDSVVDYGLGGGGSVAPRRGSSRVSQMRPPPFRTDNCDVPRRRAASVHAAASPIVHARECSDIVQGQRETAPWPMESKRHFMHAVQPRREGLRTHTLGRKRASSAAAGVRNVHQTSDLGAGDEHHMGRKAVFPERMTSAWNEAHAYDDRQRMYKQGWMPRGNRWI